MRPPVALSLLVALAGLHTSAQALPLRKGESLAAEAPVHRLIVKLRDDAPDARRRGLPARVADLAAASGVSLAFQREMAGGAALARLPAALPPAAARALAERLQRSPLVEYAAPDQLRRPSDGLSISIPPLQPNDTHWGSQWNLMAPAGLSEGETTVGGANLPAAWAASNGSIGSSTPVVAVLDTGVLPHPEFGSRLLPGYDFISYAFTANDGDLRDSDASDPGNWISAAEADTGYCVGQAEQDSSWHGTQVAGVVAAQGNNASAIAGIAWNARILPVRVLGKCGGYDSDILDALRWAAGLSVSGVPANPTPADVLNLSFGAPGACSAAYAAAFRDVRAAGATVVAATGNEAGYEIQSPANCANVIAVTGHAIDGTSYFYGNVGPEVAISAPAGGYGTDPDGNGQGNSTPVVVLFNSGTTTPGPTWTVDYWEGTSLAAPHVAGAIALIRTLQPNAGPDVVRTLLTSHARAFPAGSWCALSGRPQSGSCGAGLLDVAQVVAAAAAMVEANLPPVATALPAQLGRAGQAFSLRLTADDPNGDTLTWTAVTLPAGATLSTSGHFSWSAPVAGVHELVYEVSDGLATDGPVTVQLNISPAPAAAVGGGGSLSPGWLAALVLLGLRRWRQAREGQGGRPAPGRRT